MAERTKLWIAQVVKRLMQTKDVEKIRVTDIYAAAQIERATFYYHFRDKYDAIAWIFAQDAGETDILNEKDAARGLEKMREDFLFYKRAYEDTSETPLWRYMLEYFTARYSNLAKEKNGGIELDEENLYRIRFYCYGAIGMTREWLFSDCTKSALDAVRAMYGCMPSPLRALFFDKTDSELSRAL